MAKPKESYEEWKQRKGQEGSIPAAGAKSSHTVTESTGPKESYEEWKARKEGKSSRQYVSIGADLINGFLKDAEGFLTSAKTEYDSLNYSIEKNTYISRMTDADRLKSRGRQIQQLLERNALGKEYDDIRNYLVEFEKAADETVEAFRNASDFYAQFEDEDSYSRYMGYQKDREEKGNLDLDEAQKEIAALEEELNGLKRNKTLADSYRIADNVHFGTPYAAAQQGYEAEENDKRIGELRAQIAEKKQYLTQAKRVQEQNKLSGVADPESEYYDPAFSGSSAYQSTIKKDTAWWENEVGDAQYEWINNQNGFREKHDGEMADLNRMAGGEYTSPYAEKHYDQLTEDEINIYNYYYAKEGKEKAQEYLDSIQETLNSREASDMFLGMKDKTLLEMAFGVAAGLDQFESGFEGAVRLMMGDDSYTPASAKQMASGMVREDLGAVGGTVYDVITNTSNMMPSVLTSLAVGAVNPAAGAWAGSAMVGTTAAGGAYQEAINLGWEKNQARAYGIMVGASEVAMEKLLGGITAFGGGNGIGDLLTKGALSKVDNVLGRVALKLGASMMDEGLEEGIQAVVEPWLESMITGGKLEISGDEVLYSSLLGALSAVALGGVSIGTQEYGHYSAGKDLKSSGVTAEQLKEIGSKFSADTVAYQLAGRVDENTGAYTIGRMFHEIGATLTEQNQAQIAEKLQQKGMGEYYAKVNARGIAYIVEGVKIPQRIAESINSDRIMGDVMREVINENSTIYQRTQGYKDVLRKLAEEVSAPKAAVNANQEAADSREAKETGSGATTLRNTGEAAQVKRVAQIQDGSMKLELTDGRTVDAADASYRNDDEALLYETVAKLGVSADYANELIDAFKTGKVPANVYSIGIQEAVRYGQFGMEYDVKNGAFSSMLTDHQRNTAYKIGRIYAEKAAESAPRATRSAKSDGKAAKGYTNIRFEGDISRMDSKRGAELKFMDFIAREFAHTNVYVFESYVDEKSKIRVYKDRHGKVHKAPNGKYTASGDIYVDLNAGQEGEGYVLNTFAHELTHHIKAWSPAKFKALAEFLVKEYGETGQSMETLVRQRMKKSKLSFGLAYEEVVADSMEAMFADPNILDKLQKLKAQDQNLFNRIKAFVDKWVAKLRKFYHGNEYITREGEMAAQLKNFERLQDLFAEALVDAGENFQSAEKGTTDDGGIMHSLREFEDGVRFVDVQMDAKTFDGMTVAEMNKAAKTILMERFAGKVIGIDNRVFVNGDSVNEYLHPSKSIDAGTRKAKLTAAGELDNLLDAGIALPNRPDGADGHIHPDAIDFSYFKTIFKVGKEYFEGIVNIKNIKKGKLLKDVTKIRNITQDIVSSYGENPKSNFLRDVSMYSIRNDGDIVKKQSLTPGEEGVIANQDGDPVAYSTEDGSVMLSMRTYEEDGRDAFRGYLEKCVSSKKLTKTEMQEMLDGIEDIYQTCKEFKDKYAPFSAWSDAAVVRDTHGRPVFSVVTPNGDYKMNLDFSLVCKKRRTLDAVFNEMSRRGIIDDFELGQKSVVKINEIIRKHGFETACALCFVDAKRFRQASMADAFTNLYNELVLSLVPEDRRSSIEHFNFGGYETIKKVNDGIHTWDASKLDFSHLDEVMKNYESGTVEYKAAKYIKSHPEGRKLLLRGDFMSSKGFDAVKTQNKDILKLYNSKKGTGGPKAAFGDVQYLNEIIKKARTWTPKKAYEVGGVRIQSFSDYVPRMVFDYVQMIYDLAATKLPAHAYSKEALFVKQFGLTGIKINMSLIPAIAEGGIAPGLDANGNYVWAGESFDFETAKQIQNAEGYTENCGTICVGVSYQHILKLLGDPDIRMVIPYHKSGLNPIVAHMNKIAAFTDYTTLKTNPGGCQNTIDKDGSKVKNDFNFNGVLKETGDPKATVRQYLNWCAEHSYTPRFAEFAWHENYYKLIEDFTLYDKDGNYVPQREVKAVFPTADSAFGSMKDLIQEGLQEDAVIEGRRDSNLSSIVDEIEQTLPRSEEEIAETEVEQADRDLEAGVLYSPREYSKQVDEVKNNTHDPNNHVYMGTTPIGIVKIMDLPKLPMLVTTQHIYSMAVSAAHAHLEGRFKPRINYHNLGWDVVKKLPELINKPVLLIKSNTEPNDATFVVVTSQVDNSGDPIIVAIKPNGKGNYFNIEFPTNFMLSGYGKHGIQGYIARAKTENRILYANKNSQKSKNTTSVQFADNILSSDYTTNLADFKKIVNSKFAGTVFKNGGLPKLSDRGTDSVSNRSLLANAFDTIITNPVEKQKLEEYRQNIQMLNEQEAKLRELRGQIKETSFAKGPRDKEKLKALQLEATKTANRISTLDGRLLRFEASAPLQRVLDREKQKAAKRQKQKDAAVMEKYRDDSKKSLVKNKIRNMKKRLESSLLQPTEKRYIPEGLANAMIELCGLINDDTDLYKKDGTINKAQQRRDEIKVRLNELLVEYKKLDEAGISDKMYGGEFDETVYAYLENIRDQYAGKAISDMDLDSLRDLYEQLRGIEETLQDARKLIGYGEAEGVYEAAEQILDEQNRIAAGRRKGKRGAIGSTKDRMLDYSLSPMRNVERMSGYNQESYLVRLFRDMEKGTRKKNFFMMNAYKAFEKLSGDKRYDGAVYDAVKDITLTDIRGRKFRVSKMQMMQAILSWERETANGHAHIQKGGMCFADLDLLSKGKVKEAISPEHSHLITGAGELAMQFQELLKDDKWCQEYMNTAREFFNTTAKNAINETMLTLKHRIVAKEKSYIPFEVNQSQVVREISAGNDIQQTITSYGMLQGMQTEAPQAIIISGLNNILDRHIEQVGTVYGLAIPTRNFNKVWNCKGQKQANESMVKAAVMSNWGNGGGRHIEQAIQDIQSPRRNEQTALYRKVKSNYISATFLLNYSVVTKQIGSLFAANSMLRWRDPVRMIGNLLVTMVNHKKIAAEIDKYTATAWMRRQGVSDAELTTLMTEARKSWFGRVGSKLPAIINPTKQITAMDSAVAMSLWKYAKRDTAKRTGLKGEDLLKATAEFYDDLIENTQSMTDVLHRPEVQKKSDIVSESLGMFKTDLYQMAGQLRVSAGRMVANPSKENAKNLGKTVYAVAAGAVWGQLMTTLFALLRYKVNSYRDEEDKDLTIESWWKRQKFSLIGDLVGYVIPLMGGELVGIAENISYGESEAVLDNITLSAINDLIDTVVTVANSIKEQEMPTADQWKKIVAKSLQLLGVPTNNILRTWEAIQLHAKDIANGEFLSYEAGAERSAKNHIHRIIEMLDAGDNETAKEMFEDAVEEIAIRKAKENEVSDDEMKAAISDLKTALGKKYKDGLVTESMTKQMLADLFEMDKNDIAWKIEEWGYESENEDDFGKYNQFYDAVKTGKNLKAVIKEYTDKGVNAETLRNQITTHFKDDYMKMSNSEKAGIKGYLINGYTQLGMTRDEAMEKIAEWEHEAKHPELTGKVSYSQYKNWESAAKGKVSLDIFAEVVQYRKTDEGVRDQEEVGNYIDRLPLSEAQKDALWCCFYEETSLKKAHWH